MHPNPDWRGRSSSSPPRCTSCSHRSRGDLTTARPPGMRRPSGEGPRVQHICNHEENEPMGRLEGKVAIITGGASGLAEGTARLFASEGAAGALGDIHAQRGPEVVKKIESEGGKATFQVCDVRTPDQVKALVDHAEQTFGHVHIMVANAGIGGAASRKQLEDVTEEEFEEVMQVNAAGAGRSFKYAP